MFRGSPAPWPFFGGNDRRGPPSQKTGVVINQMKCDQYECLTPVSWFTVMFVGIFPTGKFKGALNLKRKSENLETDSLTEARRMTPASRFLLEAPLPPRPTSGLCCDVVTPFPIGQCAQHEERCFVDIHDYNSWQWWFNSSFSLRTKKKFAYHLKCCINFLFLCLSTNQIVSINVVLLFFILCQIKAGTFSA